MNASYKKRPWVPTEAEQFIETHALRYANMNLEALDKEAHHLVQQQEQYMDRECLQLNAASNVLNPKSGAVVGFQSRQSSQFGLSR